MDLLKTKFDCFLTNLILLFKIDANIIYNYDSKVHINLSLGEAITLYVT